MKLKYDFVINEIASSTVAVPVGKGSENFKGYIKLNETGAFIFSLLKKDISRDEIIERIMKEFEGDKEKITEQVDSFIKRLKEADVLCRE